MNSLINQIAEIGIAAAKQIIELATSRIDVTTKVDNTPVTQVDVAISAYLEEALPKIINVPVISEETEWPNDNDRARDSAYWLVDPLDGTKDFIAGERGVSVNIALMVDAHPVLGLVVGPFFSEVYVAWLPALNKFATSTPPQGCFKRDFTSTEWNSVSCSEASSPLRVYLSRSHGSQADFAVLSDVSIGPALRLGSALKMCRIAEGAADAYVRSGPTGEWDTAAGQVILVAAGGQLLGWNGQPLKYNKEQPINSPFIAIGRGLTLENGKILISR